MTVTPPVNLSYGTIEARFAIDVVDSEDADTHPDLVPPTGYVTFTSSVAKILNPTSVPDELVILRSPIFGVIDEQGYLCTPNLKLKSPQYPRGVPAYRGVELIATDDPDLNPLHSTYTVTYSLKNSVGDRIEGVESHALTVPGGTVQDLAKIIPPDAADAIGIPQANASAARAEAAALSADQRAAVAEQAAVIASGALLDSAQFVADELVDAESPARQVLDPLVNAKTQAVAGARESTYNVTGSSLRRFRAALAKATVLEAGAPCTIVWFGDSITQSTVAAPFSANSIPARVQAMIERRVGAYSQHNTFMDVDSQDTRWSRTGTWGRSGAGNKGWVGGQAHTTTQDGATATIGPLRGTRIVYRYLKGPGYGTFTYALDGAAAVTVDASASTESVGALTLTGLSEVAHSLVITNKTARHTQIDGEVRYGDGVTSKGGVRIIKAAVAGQILDNFVTGTGAGTPMDLLAGAAPALTIIALETNDWGNWATPVISYKAKMALIINVAKASGDVLLVACPPPGAPMIAPPGTALKPYTDALYALADELDCALLDMQARWGSHDDALANGLMYDVYHPTDLGNADYAHALFEALFQHTDDGGGLQSRAGTWRARQRFGLGTYGLELGAYEDGGFPPSMPYLLASAANGWFLGGAGPGQIRSDITLQAGKKFKSENAALPAVDADGFTRSKPYTTANRPTAANAGNGGYCYDSTLGKPIWSDGTNWKDASGATV